MSADHLGQGVGTIAAGLALGLICLALMRSEAYQRRMVDSLVRARPRAERDRPQLARGMRLALAFGVVMAAILVAIGIATIMVG